MIFFNTIIVTAISSLFDLDSIAKIFPVFIKLTPRCLKNRSRVYLLLRDNSSKESSQPLFFVYPLYFNMRSPLDFESSIYSPCSFSDAGIGSIQQD
jgi:hypothetical protein